MHDHDDDSHCQHDDHDGRQDRAFVARPLTAGSLPVVAAKKNPRPPARSSARFASFSSHF
jgi:hypothetical protein